MRRFVFVALFACAQNTVAPPSGTYASGTRLRANVIDGGGGATLFQSWHDSDLGFDCFFAPLGDGSLRCVPSADGSGELAYLDAACTQQALVLTDTPPSSYVSVLASQPEGPWCGGSPDPMSETVTVYTVGGAQPASTSIFVMSSGSCVPATQGNSLVFPASEADPTTFVGARAVVESRGALDSRILVADDGATELAGILDHATGAPCVMPDSLYSIGDGPVTLRCISPSVAWDGFYDSSSCSGPREAYIGAGCAPPPLAVSALDAACGPLPVFALGAVDPAVTPYYGSDGACTAFSYSSLDFYPETAPADLSAYPALGEARLGTGRLELPLVTAAGDGRALAVETLRTTNGLPAFFDTARDKPCGATTFAGALVYCVTAGTAQLTAFADAACTQPLAQTPLGCDPPTEAIDGLNMKVVAISGPWTGPVYQMQSSCTPVAPTGAYYTVGAAIDPSSVFPALTERTE